jgi:hypothetical protein
MRKRKREGEEEKLEGGERKSRKKRQEGQD